MSKVIELALKRPPAKLEEEPCHKCKLQERCHNTCQRADVWWSNFAKQFKGGNYVR